MKETTQPSIQPYRRRHFLLQICIYLVKNDWVPLNTFIKLSTTVVSHKDAAFKWKHVCIRLILFWILTHSLRHNKYSTQFYSKTNYMHQCIQFILFWNDTLHVSDGFPSIIRSSRLYIQQQAYVKQTLLLLLASKQTAESVWHMPVAVITVLNSWWWTENRPKHVECLSKI